MCSGRFSPSETFPQCPQSKMPGKPQYQDLSSGHNGTMVKVKVKVKVKQSHYRPGQAQRVPRS